MGKEGPVNEELMLLDDDEGAYGWQAEALCAQTDPEAFFPEKGGSTREAKSVCQKCNVKEQCLSERERRKLKRAAV